MALVVFNLGYDSLTILLCIFWRLCGKKIFPWINVHTIVFCKQNTISIRLNKIYLWILWNDLTLIGANDSMRISSSQHNCMWQNCGYSGEKSQAWIWPPNLTLKERTRLLFKFKRKLCCERSQRHDRNTVCELQAANWCRILNGAQLKATHSDWVHFTFDIRKICQAGF